MEKQEKEAEAKRNKDNNFGSDINQCVYQRGLCCWYERRAPDLDADIDNEHYV